MFYIRLKKIVLNKWENRSFSFIFSFLVSDVSESLILLKSNERCEQIAQVKNERFAQVPQRKWAIVSESLIFGQKTSDLHGHQMSEFPALCITRI